MLEVEQRTLMIFDTNCVLCSGAVRFILKHECNQNIQFINAWSETGASIAAQHGLTKQDLNNTFLVVTGGRGFTHSSAALQIAKHLKFPWRAFRVFWIVPKFIRDAIYSFIAKRRYRLFGYEESCLIIGTNERHRFIDV